MVQQNKLFVNENGILPARLPLAFFERFNFSEFALSAVPVADPATAAAVAPAVAVIPAAVVIPADALDVTPVAPLAAALADDPAVVPTAGSAACFRRLFPALPLLPSVRLFGFPAPFLASLAASAASAAALLAFSRAAASLAAASAAALLAFSRAAAALAAASAAASLLSLGLLPPRLPPSLPPSLLSLGLVVAPPLPP